MRRTPPPPSGALVLFSGGQDSAVCLAWALERFERVETIGFAYGQRHAVELEARQAVRAALPGLLPRLANRLGPDHLVDLSGYGAIADSALTTEREIALRADGLPSTYVPGRNLVFFCCAAALADRRGLKTLVGGMCETDYSGYPDCRRDTLDALQQAINLGMAQDFVIETPLSHQTKAETWALAEQLGGSPLVEAVRGLTHTCYRGDRGEDHAWGRGCGHCPACELRAKGWAEWTASRAPAS